MRSGEEESVVHTRTTTARHGSHTIGATAGRHFATMLHHGKTPARKVFPSISLHHSTPHTPSSQHTLPSRPPHHHIATFVPDTCVYSKHACVYSVLGALC